MPDSTPLFVLRRVGLTRGAVTILSEISLELPRATITALIGPSGAGKSTLLRLLNRLDSPTSGEIDFEGEPIERVDVRSLRRRVGFVFQRPTMFLGSVADNLRVAAELGGEVADEARIVTTLSAAGLDESYRDRPCEELSGGEQQRVSIARALMTRPEALLLDEPTSALDPEVATKLLATMETLSREHGVAIVMVTHRLHEALHRSSYTVMMEAGHVVESGPTPALFESPKHPRTREFIATAGDDAR
jgi:putative ABC transport system ATP-binding protein